jgi:hypothetical protein
VKSISQRETNTTYSHLHTEDEFLLPRNKDRIVVNRSLKSVGEGKMERGWFIGG